VLRRRKLVQAAQNRANGGQSIDGAIFIAHVAATLDNRLTHF